MGCCGGASSSTRLSLSRPIISGHFSPSTILCCTNGPHESTSSPSTTSYSRRWDNPLRHRRRRPSPPLDPVRHWVEADTYHLHASQEKLSVVSYNILGDRNAMKHKDMYTNVPSDYMKWEYRKRVICEELLACTPDIICLQEVDRYYDLLSVFEKAGYVSSYKRRTGGNVDGCAMFWKADKFQLLEAESIEYKQYGLRDNVAQLSVLEMCEAKSRRIVVGNIHVLYNPSRGDIKLGQIRFLSSRAHSLSEKWGNVPVVLAGDYNSTPESAIYKFISSSELNIMLYDRRELSGQRSCNPIKILGVRREKNALFVLMDRFLKYSWTDEEVKVANGGTKCRLVVHPLNLNSSYSIVKGSRRTRGSGGEPLATSYHSKFLGTVDYLWYSAGLVPVRVLDTIPIDVLRKIDGLPCKKLGSDHLALVSEFAFKQGNLEAIGNDSSTL